MMGENWTLMYDVAYVHRSYHTENSLEANNICFIDRPKN